MKTSLVTRLLALLASVVFAVVIIGSTALIGHPAADSGAVLAKAKPVVVVTNAR